jgi:hypothetical protein
MIESAIGQRLIGARRSIQLDDWRFSRLLIQQKKRAGDATCPMILNLFPRWPARWPSTQRLPTVDQ